MSKEKTSKIRFNIKLDENDIPSEIQWIASDSKNKEGKKTKSMMVYMWDPEEKNTLSINLWTNEMMIDEMHVHFYQSLMTMAESFQKATGNDFALEDMKKFCAEFDEKVKKKVEETQKQEK